MIQRRQISDVRAALARQPAVALIGPRQIGKTTLAQQVAAERPSIYLDLEASQDRIKLADAPLYLRQFEDRLVVLDEIHRVPKLFHELRGLIDQGRRRGRRTGRFLLLGSASMDLLRQAGESLAGRIAYVDLGPFDVLEVDDVTKLWVRGGFPDSCLAAAEALSLAWRRDLIRSYLERDIPMFAPQLSLDTMEALWKMLAHSQGCMLNVSRLAGALSVSAQSVTRYIDLLVKLLLVRRLRPYHANAMKRLVKTPKVYIRDSGLTHAQLGLVDFNAVCGHPVVGATWEGFVVENLVAATPPLTQASFYRTSAGAEIDLLLDIPGHGLWAVDIKRGLSAKPAKGFHIACDDLKPAKCFAVNSGTDRYPIAKGVEAIGLAELTATLAAIP